MASTLQLLPLGSSFIQNLPKPDLRICNVKAIRGGEIHCVANKEANSLISSTTGRQKGYYEPSSWNHEFLMSIGDQCFDPKESNIKELEETVSYMLEDQSMEEVQVLQLIDDIQRLGLGYRFREKIKFALNRIKCSEKVKDKIQDSIYTCCLYFTLLRQQGYEVSTDIFENFKDGNGSFRGSLAQDVPGLLKLHEASHVAYIGETVLEEARVFTTLQLQDRLGETETKICAQVSHALEIPFIQRMRRLEARWNIETYSKKDETNQMLLRLAALDFNMVQSLHQRDLQQVSSWWKDLGLANKMSFARDRLMESFFWSLGMVFEPQFSECLKGLTKVAMLITVIDDFYDVYGSLEELELFTDAVERWDINALQHLPDYTRICFLALYNTINSMAYDVLKEKGHIIHPHLAKVWADMCKLWLKEAQWSHNKHMPPFDEYLSVGWVSSSGPLLLVHAYFLMTQNITNEEIECLNSYPDLLRYPSTIFRLSNDLSSSKAEIESGESANAISCYMHEYGVSEEVARKCLRSLIDENWKMMNKELITNFLFENSLIEIALNLARISQCHYQHGNAHSDPNVKSRNRVLSVIIEPIQL